MLFEKQLRENSPVMETLPPSETEQGEKKEMYFQDKLTGHEHIHSTATLPCESW